MAVLRQRALAGDTPPTRLIYSARSHRAVIYREEIDALAARNDGLSVTYTLTREQPPGWTGESRRIDRAMIEAAGFPAGDAPLALVCGPTPLVEQAAADLLALGHDEARVKTERFGPGGDTI